jgi:hypothetical protein
MLSFAYISYLFKYPANTQLITTRSNNPLFGNIIRQVEDVGGDIEECCAVATGLLSPVLEDWRLFLFDLLEQVLFIECVMSV